MCISHNFEFIFPILEITSQFFFLPLIINNKKGNFDILSHTSDFFFAIASLCLTIMTFFIAYILTHSVWSFQSKNTFCVNGFQLLKRISRPCVFFTLLHLCVRRLRRCTLSAQYSLYRMLACSFFDTSNVMLPTCFATSMSIPEGLVRSRIAHFVLKHHLVSTDVGLSSKAEVKEKKTSHLSVVAL